MESVITYHIEQFEGPLDLLLSLEVPGLQCDTAGTGYHSSSLPGQRLSTEPPSAFRSPRVGGIV